MSVKVKQMKKHDKLGRVFKRCVSLVLTAVMLVTMTPVGILPGIGDVKAASYSYNVSSAIAYAEEHWNDGVGLCAEFVSKCVRAGGINIPIKTLTYECFNAVSTATGVPGQWLTLDANGYALYSQNSAKLSQGDIVMTMCPNCHMSREHIMLCGGYDSSGYATFYAHNNARHNERVPANSCIVCETCGIRCGAQVLHIAAYNAQAAITYARKYTAKDTGDDTSSYNKAYPYYAGNDCANYVSQCLEAGGFHQSESWKPGSLSWIRCPNMIEYFKSLGYKVIYQPSASEIIPGNPVFTSAGHVMICTGKNQNGTPLLCGHSNNRLDCPTSGPFYCTIMLNEKNIVTPNGSQGTPNGHTVPTRMLSRGHSGSDVRWVQQMLNYLMGAGLSEDGIFGTNTYNAVRSFQSRYGLAVDGIVGPDTRNKIQSEWQKRQVVNPSSISISSGTLNITTGSKSQLSAKIEPSNSTNKSITWSSSDNAIATVSNGVITGVKEGTAKITAKTHNGKSATCTVNVHDKRTITFVNDDDTVISTQSVDWNGSATAPQAPEKEGYSFAGWSGTYQNVKDNGTVRATYTKNQYTVTFKETNGKVIGTSQKVYHGESALVPAKEALDIPDGYSFKGWSESTNSVKSDMTIYPVYEWADSELPMVVAVGKDACTANYAEGMYYLHFTIKNHSAETRNARVMIYMVTNEGKLVAQGETRTVRVPAAETDDNGNVVSEGIKEVSDMYIACSNAADKARILVLDDYESAVPLAEMVDVPVVVEGYGEWIDKKPASGTEYQTRTLYRYKNVSYTTSTSTNNISGWTLYNTQSSVKDNGDSHHYGQGRSSAAPAPNVAYSRCWASRISYPYDPSPYLVPTYNISIDTYGGDSYRSMVRWIQTVLCRYGYGVDIDGIFGYNTAAAVKNFQRANGLSVDGIVGPDTRNRMQSKLNSDPLYRYYYSTATTTYTYRFYKVDASWSGWQEAAVTGDTSLNIGTTNKLVETKTQYRVKIDAKTAQTTGEVMKPKCVLPDEAKGLAGKDAVVIVFKNKVNQIAEDNVEYVGSTKIAADGSLNISFIPREEQTYEGTGDYTVVLGVKGTSNYVKVGTIEAPRPVYTVSFVDAEGKEIDTQEVEEGHNAEVPNAPERKGYQFAGWDAGVTNIHANLTIKANYEPEKYNVSFVDWENRTFTSEEYSYGDVISLPEISNVPEGLELTGWTVAEGTVVDKNLLCEAVYEKPVYKVTFVDWEGNVVEEQEVAHGDAAMSPGVTAPDEEARENTVPEVLDNMSFLSWGENIDLSCITGNLVVGAIYLFDETVEMPVASVKTGEFSTSQKVTLTSETDDALIYYTLDGSDPTDSENENVKIYNGAITVSESSKLKFYATKLGMNNSAVGEEWYAINTPGNVPMHIINIQAMNFFNESKIESYRDFVKDNTMVNVLEIVNEEYDDVELQGIFYDSNCTEPWQESAETITSSLTLYAMYDAKKFNVTYLDENGDVITTGKVAYGTPADNEVAPEKSGYRFVGWDSEDNANCVVRDITVKAKYIEEANYTVIAFPRKEYAIMEDTNFTLRAKVTYASNGDVCNNEEISWVSTDESVAIVDSQGNVTGLKKGNTTIIATVNSSGEKAECSIKVTGNPNNSICLFTNSTYRLDEEFLRNIETGKNKVSDVKKNMDSDSLEFYDCDNIKLEDNENVGTNTIIRMLDENGNILDMITVIILGDYNGDGLINGKDVSGIARCLLGKEQADAAELRAMDVNGDGNVNNRDAAMLARYLVGKEEL